MVELLSVACLSIASKFSETCTPSLHEIQVTLLVVVVVGVVVIKIYNWLAFTVVIEDGEFGPFISSKHYPTVGIEAVRGTRMAPWLYNGLFLCWTVDVEYWLFENSPPWGVYYPSNRVTSWGYFRYMHYLHILCTQ